MKKLTLVVTISVCLLGLSPAGAGVGVELLINGHLEGFGSGPLGWTLEEFPSTGTMNFDTAEQVGFADVDGTGLGLFLKPFAGGSMPPGTLVNAVLSQTVPATPGEGYSFSGWSRWELNYAGGVATLDPGSPFGAIPSPTRTEMELAFLDVGGNVIGSPFLLDLRTQQNNFDNWVQHSFNDTFGGGNPLVAPAGTASARVTAQMIDGAYNTNPQQAAFFDDFELIAQSTGLDTLENGNLDMLPIEFPGWTVTEDPMGIDTVNLAGFAQNANSSGAQGAFLHPWANGGLVSNPNDAIFVQEVAGTAGGDYTFSMWSKFEGNFSGGVSTLLASSPNGAVPSPTQTMMELAFLDAGGNVIGSPITLDIRADRELQSTTGNANDLEWYQHLLQGKAPAGTETIRVTGAMIDGVFNDDPQQSAFFDDFSLMLATAAVNCDFNGDTLCDGADADLLVAEIAAGTNGTNFDLTGDGLVNGDDRDAWLAEAGAMNLPSGNPYLLGDANLDGSVNGQDFVVWNGNKFTNIAAWTAGDFTADGSVNGQDFVLWNGNKFTSADGVAAVPEASAQLLSLMAIVGLVCLRRRAT